MSDCVSREILLNLCATTPFLNRSEFEVENCKFHMVDGMEVGMLKNKNFRSLIVS